MLVNASAEPTIHVEIADICIPMGKNYVTEKNWSQKEIQKLMQYLIN